MVMMTTRPITSSALMFCANIAFAEELVEDGMANLTLDANAEARHPQFGHINFMNRDTSLTDLPPLLVIDREGLPRSACVCVCVCVCGRFRLVADVVPVVCV